MQTSLVTDEVKMKVDDQKKHYKQGAKSLCKNCIHFEDDCFDSMKSCEKDEKTNYSYVKKCSDFSNKNPIVF